MMASSSQRPLAIFVHEGKTGSSTMRTVLRELQRKNETDRWLCDFGSTNWTVSDVLAACNKADIMIGGTHGLCTHFQRPCFYFTLMREPVARLISAYNYFCLTCSDNGNYCRPDLTAGLFRGACPRMQFLEWATIHANQYTWHWSGHFAMRAEESGVNDAYFRGSLRGFVDRPPLTDADFAAATRTLAAPNMLVLRTEQLDILGWDKLAAWLAGTRAARLLGIVARQRSAVGSANGTVVKFNNGSWVYTPTAAEKERVCVVNHFDCKLYGSVGVGLHPYHIDNSTSIESITPGGYCTCRYGT